MGLGTYPETSIQRARQIAMAARSDIQSGIDPIDKRSELKKAIVTNSQIPTFHDATILTHQSLKPGWSSSRHSENWINSMHAYVLPVIGNIKVDELRASNFAEVLSPIWISKTDTATRVKQRCSSVMDWCIAHDYVEANPVDVASKLLPKIRSSSDRVVHHPSMRWQDLPVFIKEHLHGSKTTKNMLMRSLPETERNRNWTMNDLVLQLYGKYNQRPHPMHVGKALRRLGWKKVRDWSAAGEGRRFWSPNDRSDS